MSALLIDNQIAKHPFRHPPQIMQLQDHPRVSAVVTGVTELLNSHPDVDQKLPHGCGLAGYNDYAIEIGMLVCAAFVHTVGSAL